MLKFEDYREIMAQQRKVLLSKPAGTMRTSLWKIDEFIKLPHIVIIAGMRRTGKSTFLRQIISKYYSDNNFYYINFEDERLLSFRAEKFDALYEALVSLSGEKKTFFIDEIQNVPGFESFVRRFYEAGFKFFITGSSANLLSREIGTKLAGRHIDLVIDPFSFNEYLQFHNLLNLKNELHLTESRALIKKLFFQYLTEGGMPEYLQYKNGEIISRTYEDVIIKDIAVRYGLSNLMELRELYLSLITSVSGKFSFTRLKKTIGLGSVHTVKNYLNHLTETYFAVLLNKFDHSVRKQIANDKKMYVIDNGFVSAISLKLTQDRGRLLENLVCNELKKRGNITYFSNHKAECDFVLQKPGSVIEAYQVCYDMSDDNYERELRGIISALYFFNLQSGVILTNDQEKEITVEDKKILMLPVWKWLLHSGH